MGSSGLAPGLWQSILNLLFSHGDISVPSDFHDRCQRVAEMLDNDVSGIVGTIVDYSINSASEAKFKIECPDETLESLLDEWLSRINLNIDGVPIGLQELAKEYYRERWSGSSLCLMRVGKWEKITFGKNSITAPTVLWFTNGSSVYIDRKNEINFKLGTDKYYLDKNKKIELPAKNEDLIIHKCFSRWSDKYPSPYLIKKGIYKNWRALQVLQSKGDEVITKLLPYLFVIEKGSPEQFKGGDNLNDKDMQELSTAFKDFLEQYKNKGAKVPFIANPYDQQYKHLIPDLRNILTEELFRQGYRALLAGLGFIDLLEVTPSRQESRINPKPFVTEVNAGVDGFKSMLMDVIQLIIKENKIEHRKLFSENNSLRITNTPLKMDVESILDQIRSGFVYGSITIRTYHERLGIDHEQELERMKKEWQEDENGMTERDYFYAHLIQNAENKGLDTKISPAPITKKQIEKKKEKETNPENAELNSELETAPYKNLDEIPSYIKKMTKKCQETFMATFNSVYEETKDESKAMAIGISSAKRCMKKLGYTYDKETKTWKKKSEEKK